MTPTTYQKPEIRDSSDNIISAGTFGKNTDLCNATNDGWIDYVANDLEALKGEIDDIEPVTTTETNSTDTAYSVSVPSDKVFANFNKIEGHTVVDNGALVSATITKVVSKDSSNNVVATMPIPSAIQSLTGYGWSCPSYSNYVDFANKKYVQNVGSRAYTAGDESDSTVITDGSTTTYYHLTTAVETDISDILGATGIACSASGTLTFENANSLSVPYDLEWVDGTDGLMTVQDKEKLEVAYEASNTPMPYLPLSGGTLSGTVTEEMGNPSSRVAYSTKYTGITNGTNPSTLYAGYLFNGTDSADASLTYLMKVLFTNGNSQTRLADTWNAKSAGITFETNINNYHKVSPSADSSIYLGWSDARWSTIYAVNGTINTSDERHKENIGAIPDNVLDAWGEVQWCQFQMKDSVAKKGGNARIHCGAIAQRIKEVFEYHNLDAFRYGLLCYDEWDAKEEVKDNDGVVIEEAREAGNLYSLRYEEALCMEAAYQRRRADRLEARIEALERAINHEHTNK